MKRLSVLLIVFLLPFTSCKTNKIVENKKPNDIVETILNDNDSYFYVNFENYPTANATLPIGVFDSGTGGLTVLKAIVNYDQNNNSTFSAGSDGVADFSKESFIYLGDQANMPYGNYSKEGKVELLQEHIIKDAQFLMNNKYYSDKSDHTVNIDKKAVKAIVIACNTATAYGKNSIEDFLERAKSDVKVIGVIDAGVEGVFETMKKDENGIIGVLATAGTVASKGYRNTIFNYKKENGFIGNIEVFSQGGLGIAEAVDEDPDYFNKNLNEPRNNYKGPDLKGDYKINKELLKHYNFNFNENKMLCDSEVVDDCNLLQINDSENYIRYHLVSLMEQIKKSGTENKLKSLILGCTHYPYLEKEIKMVFNELYNLKNNSGAYEYREWMIENIQLVDPAVNTAKELYEFLNETSKFNPNGKINESEFYISVPNVDNHNNKIDELGRFPYEYKYGRSKGNIQEYVKRVPFSRQNISSDILNRFQEQIPYVYQLMQHFNRNNDKTKNLKEEQKI